MITGCRIFGNSEIGINLKQDRNVFVSGCDISENGRGFQVYHGEWYEFRENNIERNIQYGIYMWGVSRWEIDITMNWWGTIDGPYNGKENPHGAGDSISGSMNVSPWRTSPVVVIKDTGGEGGNDEDRSLFDPLVIVLMVILTALIFMLGSIILGIFVVSDVWEEEDL